MMDILAEWYLSFKKNKLVTEAYYDVDPDYFGDDDTYSYLYYVNGKKTTKNSRTARI